LQLLTDEIEARKKFDNFTEGDKEQKWIAFKKSFDQEMKHVKDTLVVCLISD